MKKIKKTPLKKSLIFGAKKWPLGGAKSGQKGQKRSKRGPPRRFFHCLLKTSAFPVLPFPFLLFFSLQYTTSLLFFPVFFFTPLHSFFSSLPRDWAHENRNTSRKLNRLGISTVEAHVDSNMDKPGTLGKWRRARGTEEGQERVCWPANNCHPNKELLPSADPPCTFFSQYLGVNRGAKYRFKG